MPLELDDLADVMATLIKSELAPLVAENTALKARVAALETREATPGRDGLPGLAGRDGVSIKGDPGERGATGERGEKGDTGERGEKGEKGDPGEKGDTGDPGERGERGDKGENGTNGANGINGKDGAMLDVHDLHAADYDGERTVTLKFRKGDASADFPITFAIPIYRGVYSADKAYEAADLVTYAGSVWIAKRATMLRPDEHGDGARDWTLCVKRGREGREGKPGPQGLIGPMGKQGQPGRDGARY